MRQEHEVTDLHSVRLVAKHPSIWPRIFIVDIERLTALAPIKQQCQILLRLVPPALAQATGPHLAPNPTRNGPIRAHHPPWSCCISRVSHATRAPRPPLLYRLFEAAQLGIDVRVLIGCRLFSRCAQRLDRRIAVPEIRHLSDDANGEPSEHGIGKPIGHGIDGFRSMNGDRVAQVDAVVLRSRARRLN
jgi:hypothetical protein